MRRTIGIALSAALAAVVAAPLLAGAASTAAFPLYAAFSWVCHQQTERSWHLAGYPLAVCVRCLGLYTGAFAGALAGFRFSRPLFLTAVALLGAQWTAEWAGWVSGASPVRFTAGFAAGFFLVPALWAEHRALIGRIKWLRREVRA